MTTTLEAARDTGAAAAAAVVTMLGTLVASGAPAPALAADVPGGSGTKAVITVGTALSGAVFEKRRDADWYRVTLKGGLNYAFVVSSNEDGCAQLQLRTLKGATVATARADGLLDDGFEFLSTSNATYFAVFSECAESDFPAVFPSAYVGVVRQDPGQDTKTKAVLSVGSTVDGLFDYGYDGDFYRLTLDKAKTYNFTFSTGVQGSISLASAAGKVVFAGKPFNVSNVKVPTSGTYYLAAEATDLFGGAYRLGVTAR